MTNRAKLLSGIASACLALGAQSDYLPDGKLKHLLIGLGIVGTFVSALFADPMPKPDAVKVPRP